MELRTALANQAYQLGTSIPAGSGTAPQEQQSDSAIRDFAVDFMETLRSGEDMAAKGMTGQADAHSVVEALASTKLAVETAVTVRDKVVEAYQEILRMPV